LQSVHTNVGPRVFRNFRPDQSQNASYIDDPKANAVWDIVPSNIVVNNAKVDQALKEFYPYSLEQAWHVETPNPYIYTMWQPWVKGYGGEWGAGHCNRLNFPYWIWYDQDLKSK